MKPLSLSRTVTISTLCQLMAAVYAVAIISERCEAGSSFFTLDRSQSPGPLLLAIYDSDPLNSVVNTVAATSILPTGPGSASMDLSANGRLFVTPHSGTIYELDPSTGSVLGRLNISRHPIEGLAVSPHIS